LPKLNMKDLASNHVTIARDIVSKGTLMSFFRNYLKHGYYPFFLQGLGGYHQRIQAVIDKVVSEDLPSQFSISPGKVNILKKILWIIASSDPFHLNIEGLSNDLGIAKMSTYHFIECLSRGRLLQTISRAGTGIKSVRKPEKMYLENTNIIAAITIPNRVEPSVGTVRETFFCSAVAPIHSVKSFAGIDFLLDDEWLVEVGGQNEDAQQLQSSGLKSNKKTRLLALDGIESGSGDRVPLYLFGLLR
jgi:uncharacterized protein